MRSEKPLRFETCTIADGGGRAGALVSALLILQGIDIKDGKW